MLKKIVTCDLAPFQMLRFYNDFYMKDTAKYVALYSGVFHTKIIIKPKHLERS